MARIGRVVLPGIPHHITQRGVRSMGNRYYVPGIRRDACKALDALVKMRSGEYDLSGTELMQAVFKPRNPILRFSQLSTPSEQSEQQGMMFLYSGAMLVFRNPRAHEIIEDDPERALEYIAFLSLLAKSLDKANRQSDS